MKRPAADDEDGFLTAPLAAVDARECEPEDSGAESDSSAATRPKRKFYDSELSRADVVLRGKGQAGFPSGAAACTAICVHTAQQWMLDPGMHAQLISQHADRGDGAPLLDQWISSGVEVHRRWKQKRQVRATEYATTAEILASMGLPEPSSDIDGDIHDGPAAASGGSSECKYVSRCVEELGKGTCALITCAAQTVLVYRFADPAGDSAAAEAWWLFDPHDRADDGLGSGESSYLLVTGGPSRIVRHLQQLFPPPATYSASVFHVQPRAATFMRVGTLLDGPRPYGPRKCVRATEVPEQLANLSLVIPVFTGRHDIPSGKEEQEGLEGLCEEPILRNFGILDLDADFTAVKEGKEPLFMGDEAKPFARKSLVKEAFGKVLNACKSPEARFQRCMDCPAFRRLYELCCRVNSALLQANAVSFFGFYSGGGGVRFMLRDQEAWCRARWADKYAKAITQDLLPARLRALLPEDVVAQLLPYIDESIYDTDKGVKPDLRRHPDTGLWPRRLLFQREHDAKAMDTADKDTGLCALIKGFWQWLTNNIPSPYGRVPVIEVTESSSVTMSALPARHGPSLVTSATTSATPKRPKQSSAPRDLLRELAFERVNKSDGATHFNLAGRRTTYYKVNDTAKLYAAMAANAGKHYVNELATPVRRFSIDYDGGPALANPLVTANAGESATPLSAIQEALRAHVVDASVSDEELHAAILRSPPRAAKPPSNGDGAPAPTGDSAHLVWPSLLVTEEDEQRITGVLSAVLAERFPGDRHWAKIIDHNVSRFGALRMLTADKWSDEVEAPEQRPLSFDCMVSAKGERLQQVPSLVDLLAATSRRNSPSLAWETHLTKLSSRVRELPLPQRQGHHREDIALLDKAVHKELEAWIRGAFVDCVKSDNFGVRSLHLKSNPPNEAGETKDYLFVNTTEKHCPNYGRDHQLQGLFLQIDVQNGSAHFRCNCKCDREPRCSAWRSKSAQLPPEIAQRLYSAPPVTAQLPKDCVTTDAALRCAKAGLRGVADLVADVFRGRLVYDTDDRAFCVWLGSKGWQVDHCGWALRLVSRVGDLLRRGGFALQKASREKAGDAAPGEDKRADADDPQAAAVIRLASKLMEPWNCKGVCDFLKSALEHTNDASWEKNRVKLLAVANGVVDLATGSFRPMQPDDRLRTICPTAWLGLNEPCPAWQRFILDISDEDPELASFRQRFLSAAVCPFEEEHIFGILYGQGGRNGKDTTMNVLKEVCGPLVGPVAKEIVVKRKPASDGAPSPHLLALRRLNLGWVSEIEKGERLNGAQMKEISGKSRITSRPLHKNDMKEFVCLTTLFLMLNHKIEVDANDEAVWPRLVLLNHPRSYYLPEHMPAQSAAASVNGRRCYPADPLLLVKLRNECSGILAWLVRGSLEMKKRGLAVPVQVLQDTKAYRSELDWIAHFVSECCTEGAKLTAPASLLYRRYQCWCEGNGNRPLSAQRFTAEMKNKYLHVKERDCNYYEGINIKPRKEEEEDPPRGRSFASRF